MTRPMRRAIATERLRYHEKVGTAVVPPPALLIRVETNTLPQHTGANIMRYIDETTGTETTQNGFPTI